MKIFSALAPLAFGRQDYVGYKVLRTSWDDAHTSVEVGAFLERLSSVDMWEPEHVEYVTYTQAADFMLSEEDSDAFMAEFGDQVKITPIIDDVGFVIDQQRNEQERTLRNTEGLRAADLPYDQYLTYPQLEQWILSTVDDELISAEVLGETYNGNNVYGIHIGDQNPSSDKKKIFIECNVHAREWVTPATCRYFIHMVRSAAAGIDLTPDSYSLEDLTSLLEHNWYIIVSANPDGYQYSHNSDRMWRKNREPNEGSVCVGTDLNRQFPVGHLTQGGSSNKCSSTYAGVEPFTTKEAQIWREWFMKLRNSGGGDIEAQLSVHSYSQLIMPPWATGRVAIPEDPADIDYQMRVSQRMQSALFNVHEKVYRVGQSRDVVGYPAGGTTEDYSYQTLGVTLSWVLELRDTGAYGFLLPADQIIPTAEETVAMFIEVSKELSSRK
ncbi:unnamed protein product [Oikopleura dioica]|uniref:Peptidase M14 domain-containing protein n=1 Tax=Oikopleura dioica TaxID=34765 RepID=E4XTI3_OIKDI|nr:unnamed protein product [Oikopleura dioica]